MKLAVVILLSFAAVARSNESDNTMEIALSFVKDCKGDYSLCVKEKLLKIVDNVRAARSITVSEGIILKGDGEKRSPKKLDSLPVDPTERDAEINSRLVDGVISIFETHSLEVKMNDADKATVQRSLEEGRGKKKGGGMGAIIGLLGAKVLFGKLFIVKLLALKALATAKVALVLAVILFVAWCLKHEHTKTTYEVVPHPHHHESHHPVHVEHVAHGLGGHEHGGYSSYGQDWNKNLDEGQNLAYSGYGHN